jgi:hypothetical protein
VRAQIRRQAEAVKREASHRQTVTMRAVIDGRTIELPLS